MKKRLGRGLDSLIARTIDQEDLAQSHDVGLDEIHFNPNQPRKVFDEEALAGLSESIRLHGVLQPVVLRRLAVGYELVAGERRCRAARAAGLSRVPAVVLDADEEQVLELALIENIQREDLGPLEEAAAYADLLSASGMTQIELSKRLGKSRAAISNTLRLLELPDAVKQFVGEGLLSAGQARTLLALREPDERVQLAEEAVAKKLSVRELERRVKGPVKAGGGRSKSAGKAARASVQPTLHNRSHYEERLRNLFGTKVTIQDAEGRGEVRLSFYSDADRDRLIHVLLTADASVGEISEISEG